MTTEHLDPEMGQREMTKEELAARRAEITKFYTDSIKHLKVQKEYEVLLMEIEEARAKRIQAQIFLGQAMAAQDEEMKKAAEEFAKAQAESEEDLPQSPGPLKTV